MGTLEIRTGKSGKPSYRAKVRVAGFGQQTKTFSKKTDAEKWMVIQEAAILEGKAPATALSKKRTLQNLLDEYERHLEISRPAHLRLVRHHLRWWAQEYGQTRLSEFKAHTVLSGQKRLLSQSADLHPSAKTSKNRTGATANRYRTTLQAAFTFGKRVLQWVAENPVESVPKLPEAAGRRRYLSKSELSHLLALCRKSRNPHLFGIVLLAAATGARRDEIRTLRWEDFDWRERAFYVRKTKNGDVRSLFMPGPALKFLKSRRAAGSPTEGFVFPSVSDPAKPIDIKTAWQAVLKRAELPDFRFHDLRHTAASHLAMSGASLLQLSEALGHRSLEMVKRYAHLSPASRLEVMETMTSELFADVQL